MHVSAFISLQVASLNNGTAQIQLPYTCTAGSHRYPRLSLTAGPQPATIAPRSPHLLLHLTVKFSPEDNLRLPSQAFFLVGTVSCKPLSSGY